MSKPSVGELIKLVTEEEFDSHKADYAYQIPTIVGTQIRISKQSNTNRLYFKLDNDLVGNITISLDNGVTSKPLQDFEGVQLTELEKGFVEVIAEATFFTLRPRGASTIKSIQRGELAPTGSTTIVDIDKVDLSSSVVIFTGVVSHGSSGATQGSTFPTVEFVNDTQIKFTLEDYSYPPVAVGFEVIEFNNVKSIQSGEMYYVNPTDIADIEVSLINPLKSILFASFRTPYIYTRLVGASFMYNIIDGKTIRFKRNGSADHWTVHYFLLEFK